MASSIDLPSDDDGAFSAPDDGSDAGIILPSDDDADSDVEVQLKKQRTGRQTGRQTRRRRAFHDGKSHERKSYINEFDCVCQQHGANELFSYP